MIITARPMTMEEIMIRLDRLQLSAMQSIEARILVEFAFELGKEMTKNKVLDYLEGSKNE